MCNAMMNRFAIIGVGKTPQGKIPMRSAASFHVEACVRAIQDAGLKKEDIDGLFLYRHFDALPGDVDVSAFTVAEQLGIRPTVLSQETYCTRSWLTHAIGLLYTGVCKYVLVSYGDNGRSGRRTFVNELSGDEPTNELAAHGDFSTMAKYAMIARKAMHLTGTGPDVWRVIAVMQRQFAALNPDANMHGKQLSYEDYDNSGMLVDPFRLYDATPITDGGRAIILSKAEHAGEAKSKPVYIRGFGAANMPKSSSQMTFDDTRYAAKTASAQALEMAEVCHDDIDSCQIYDCFTYTVEATLRDYGFFKEGQSQEFITPHVIGPKGSMPVNTSGGMLSEGYFMGLTPVTEAVLQLRGECGDRQLGGGIVGSKTPELILCSDNGGVFQSHCTLVLGKEAPCIR